MKSELKNASAHDFLTTKYLGYIEFSLASYSANALRLAASR
jgi:hypothetical protein